MVQTIIVIIIVGVAAGLVIRNFYMKYQQGKSNSCSCGCSDCDGGSADCSTSAK
jgi:hypothetical protein